MIREVLDRLVGKAREPDDTPEIARTGNLTQINLDARDLTESRKADMAAWMELGKPATTQSPDANPEDRR